MSEYDPDDLSPTDQLAILKAELDQALSLAPELARMALGYFNAFKGEGFTDSQALYLTAVQMKDGPGSPP